MESKPSSQPKQSEKSSRSRSSQYDSKFKDTCDPSNYIDLDFEDKNPIVAEEKPVRNGLKGNKTSPMTGNINDINLNSESRCSRRDSKDVENIEEMDEIEADAEFEALMRKPNVGGAMISSDPIARKIASGLVINYMNMSNGESGRKLWESFDFGEVAFTTEMRANIPKEILNCSVVCREINFTSREAIHNFRIEQRIFFQGHCIEEWFFSFGFVIPGSTNSWEQTIEAAPPNAMMRAEDLTGNVTIETTFLDDKLIICKNLVRVFYT